MKTLGLVVHPTKPEAARAAGQLRSAASGRGLTVVDASVDSCDVVVALGGDGTILRGASIASARGVPLLGVNLGRFGYLASIGESRIDDALDVLGTDQYSTDERMMIEASVTGLESRAGPLVALNEFVVERADPSRVIGLRVLLGRQEVATYTADGFIVATPTGSTAYSLSAGGPIVEPSIDAFVLTPVSAHSPLWRSIVVSPEKTVAIEVLEGSAALSADGVAAGSLTPGGIVHIRRTPQPLRLVSLGEYDFFARIKTRFGV